MDVLSLLTLASLPTVTSVAQASSAQKDDDEREEDAQRMEEFNIDVYCEAQSSRAKEVHEHRLILSNGRVWVGPKKASNVCEEGFVAEAFYLEYPDSSRVPTQIGLVSMVHTHPPLLNWIYVDRDTMELKYGNKTQSIQHRVGPWGWTEDEVGITLTGREAFTCVEDPTTHRWQLYFDDEDDELKSYVTNSRRKLQVSLERALTSGQ